FAVVDSTRQGRSFVSGKVVGVSPDSKKISLEIPQGRGASANKVDLTLTEQTQVTYAYVAKDAAKPTVGYQADVWLQEASGDTALKVNFVDVGNEENSMVGGKVIGLSVDGFTLEVPPTARGQAAKTTAMKIASTTEITFQAVGPDGAKLTEGYHARVWLQEGT